MPEQLRKIINYKLKSPFSLTITDNRSSMLSYRKDHGFFKIRLHNMFLDAADHIIDDLVSFIKTGRSKFLDYFIRTHLDKIRVKERNNRKFIIRHQGDFFNLADIFVRLNVAYFKGAVTCPISWGRRQRKKRTRSIVFGTYCGSTNLIRIHPALDQVFVPFYFVEYIVYHEMLHFLIKRDYKKIHTEEFKRREKLFKGYHKARIWEKKWKYHFLK
ncbi:hypothetical protein ACFLQ1_00150 [Candidatus Auribacterota bacterium]